MTKRNPTTDQISRRTYLALAERTDLADLRDLKASSDAAARSIKEAKDAARSENRRRDLIAACRLWDGHGIWTDEDCRAEGLEPHTTSGLWDILCDLAVENEWTAENWTALWLDVPDFSAVYENVAERAEAEVSRLAALICAPDHGDQPGVAGQLRRLNLKLLSAACRTLDDIEDRYGLWN